MVAHRVDHKPKGNIYTSLRISMVCVNSPFYSYLSHCKKNCALNSVITDLGYKFSCFLTELGWEFQPVWATGNMCPTER
jgi:hypothetical protein